MDVVVQFFAVFLLITKRANNQLLQEKPWEAQHLILTFWGRWNCLLQRICRYHPWATAWWPAFQLAKPPDPGFGQHPHTPSRIAQLSIARPLQNKPSRRVWGDKERGVFSHPKKRGLGGAKRQDFKCTLCSLDPKLARFESSSLIFSCFAYIVA